MIKRTFIVFFSFLTILVIYSELFIILKYYFENEIYTFIDGVYWVISTITTVGYGDVVFHTKIGKIFTIIVMLTGLVFVFGFVFPYVIIPWTERKLKLSLPKYFEGLKNHIIVCGYNKLSTELCKQLQKHDIDYILMDSAEENVKKALESNLKCVVSDMSEGSFKRNGINKALAVVITYDDVEKVIDILLTLSKSDTQKYVVFGDPFYVKYLHYAGATKVFTPKGIIAANIASMILGRMKGEIKVKRVLKNLGIAEVIVRKNSIIVGKSIGEIEKEFDVNIIAACKKGNFVFDPPKEEIVYSGTVMLVVGGEKKINNLFRVAW